MSIYNVTDGRKPIAQGDVIFVPVTEIPAQFFNIPVKSENGTFIVAHSETGHHHIVMERPTVRMFKGMDMFRDFLNIEEAPADVEHLRATHTHQTVSLTPGKWEVVRQKAYTPQGWEKARD